ncbi:dATP/dGTP diphosphohydrolase domain-containing protein [Sphingomonas sp. BK580]|uniref:dATP/dGTP diphosphohydrolase domain-containing protein n=1 Tax=Sphingomonas sp. BK580 TaxID=2586972 RepID=UPI00162230AC|nr:dATP/dGTP diphosphohydrolase domain-containing protein [Sphingomonas sp. BK580]MBB3693029.1 hypothetical protein [Sphingomonas sp. BK580]
MLSDNYWSHQRSKGLDGYAKSRNALTAAALDGVPLADLGNEKSEEPPAVDLSVLSLPDDDAKRGEYPMADGLLDYFPNALAEIAKVSKIGNDQHNPGQPMHWARDKSTDHANKIMRHLVDRGRLDGRGVRHTARLAWRALAMLQTEIEQEEGFPQSRRSTGQAPIQ